MSPNPTRREFLKFASITALMSAAGTTLCDSAVATADEPPLYAVPLLGDIHYDRRDHHDFDWLRAHKAGDEKQIEGYIATTETYTPRLLAAVAKQVADLKAAGVAVPFVIQLGDLVEGLCGSFDLQTRQFADAINAIEAAKLGAPLLLTKGNHDVTGPGAPEAFDQSILPWLSKQAGEPVKASFTKRQDDDLFVFFDAYKPDLAWLASMFDKHRDVRHTFFCIHPPVVPYNARADWHIYARDKAAADRAKLLSLLGGRRATVLSGHLHKFCALSRKTPTGSIGQFALSSVLKSGKQTPRTPLEGVASYGPDLVRLEPNHVPDTVEKRRALLAEEARSIEAFSYADTAGYAVARVWRDRIAFDLYCGIGQPVWKSWVRGVPAPQRADR